MPRSKQPPPQLLSQRMRVQAPEIDSLRLGTGYSIPDLDKPQILIDGVGGDSHPNSVHLPRLAEFIRDGVMESGGAPARYTVTDMCDGIAQGTDAMDYSLASRELIAMVIEFHAHAGHFDGMVLLSGSDKAVPAHLMAALRLNLPAVHVPGGVMEHGPVTEGLTHETLTLEMVGAAFYASQFYQDGWGYFLISSVEETMEISGLILFVYGLLDYLAKLKQLEPA